MKKCKCGREIEDQTIKCQVCRYDLDEPTCVVCGKKFLRYKKTRRNGRTQKGIRRVGTKACSPNCSSLKYYKKL